MGIDCAAYRRALVCAIAVASLACSPTIQGEADASAADIDVAAGNDAHAGIDVSLGTGGRGAGGGTGVGGAAGVGGAEAPDTSVDLRDASLESASLDASLRRSSGCRQPATGTSSYVRQTIPIRNATREYFLWVPRTYSPSQPYPIVFRWHGSTGNGLSGGMEIEDSSGEHAIIVSPSGIDGDWDFATNGVDVELFDRLLAQLETTYCIDIGRVFSYGFSDGGAFSNLLGCVRFDMVRGIAAVESFPVVMNCPGRVAAWMTHSPDDNVEPIALGMQVRSLVLAADDCGDTAMPVAPSPCVRYQGCRAGYPVDWCQTSGPHNPQGAFAAPGAWAFFDSLR
jgi:polyhydroxybutyrate depolymerase